MMTNEEFDKLYTDRRWTDIPKFEVVGHVEVTKEERKRIDKDVERILKKYHIKTD